MMKTLDMTKVPSSSYVASATSVGAAYASWKIQSRVLVPLFDEGGSLSYNLESMAQKMGEPLKISTWKDFYRCASPLSPLTSLFSFLSLSPSSFDCRSAGPPVVARTGAFLVSFFVAGAAHTLAARYLEMEADGEKR